MFNACYDGGFLNIIIFHFIARTAKLTVKLKNQIYFRTIQEMVLISEM